jgi:hypothetical protein
MRDYVDNDNYKKKHPQFADEVSRERVDLQYAIVDGQFILRDDQKIELVDGQFILGTIIRLSSEVMCKVWLLGYMLSGAELSCADYWYWKNSGNRIANLPVGKSADQYLVEAERC